MENKLVEVDVAEMDIGVYERFEPKLYKKLIDSAKEMEGKTIIHINATPEGGGVAELLKSQIALERSLGLKSHWFAIQGAPQPFFGITKKIHNCLQKHLDLNTLSSEEKKIYLKENRTLGKSLKESIEKLQPHVVVVHDPQPLPLIEFIPDSVATILRIHPDLSTPCVETMELLKPFAEKYQHLILSSENYMPSFPWFDEKKISIIPPAIDPLTEKNIPMNFEKAQDLLVELGINKTKPILTQVSRFDPWKDPMGVLKAYYLAKNEIPNLQLVLAGFITAQDDPEAPVVFQKVKKHASGDPDIFLFSDVKQIGKIRNEAFINALYTASTVMIQKSLREGFGLTMTEAMWKSKPLVAGETTGALIQIKDKENGIIINTAEEASEAIIKLLKDEKLRQKLGEAAYESVKENFLLPRFLLDNIEAYGKVAK